MTESRVKTISYQWALINAPDYKRAQGKESLEIFPMRGKYTIHTIHSTLLTHVPYLWETHMYLYSLGTGRKCLWES